MGDEPSSDLLPGIRFRGLLVHNLLGRGSMGSAFLASHSVLQAPFVIKTFVPTDRDVFGEARLAARVCSPHVVDVVDAGIEDGLDFVIHRYVDGLDLDELVARMRAMRKVLPTSVVAAMVADAARGLHAIHQVGVVHRDIKPANLYLSGDGDALVGDFGVALDAADMASDPSIAGTPLFMSPETWQRNAAVDHRADIYSLGGTGHYLATGAPPFSGDMAALSRAHLRDQYEPPSALRPGAAYLFAVLAHMLAKEPRHRPEHAGEVARALATIAGEPPAWDLRSETHARLGDLPLTLERGDLAAVEADVIVCAANWKLTMRVGVAEALRNAGGDELERAATAKAPAGMGDVVWTEPGRLRARWVAHAVSALASAVCIQRCVLRVLLAAEARGATSVAFPALGTGVGGVSHALSARLTLAALRTYARMVPESAMAIRVVLHDEPALAAWTAALRGI